MSGKNISFYVKSPRMKRSSSPINSNQQRRNQKLKEKDTTDTKHNGLSNRTSCHVYVSSIPQDFKRKEIKDLFSSVVGNVVYAEVFYDKNGKPRNSAVIEFESADMAKEALQKMHRMEVKGRKINVKSRNDVMKSGEFKFYFDREKEQKNKSAINDKREGSSHRSGSSYTGGTSYVGESSYKGGSSYVGNSGFQDTSSRWKHGQTYGIPVAFLESLDIDGPLGPGIFVAHLDHRVTEDDLCDLFKIAGTVVDSEVMRDAEGNSRGIATVEFEHPLQAVQAITMLNDQRYFNRRIVVTLNKFNDRRGPSFKLPKGLKGVGFGLGVNGEAIKEVSELSHLQHEINARTRTSNTVVNKFGTEVNPSPPLSGNSGMENQGYNLGLGLGALASALNALTVGGYGNNTSGILGGNAQPSSGGNTQPFSGGNAQPSSTDFSLDSIMATNLPLDCTSWDLRKLFNKFGNVKYVEIKKNGIGFARLSSAAEARQTADMLDNYWFNGRIIHVSVV